MNYRMIKYITGWLLIFEALFMTVPAITAVIYRESELWHFLMVMAGSALIGLLMILRRPANTTLYAKEGFVIVSLSWIVLSLVGSLPLFISGAIPNYIDALFETVSGFTTTGASVVPTVEALPKCMLMWRSFTHWVGGMGVLVFIMAFVPLSGGHTLHIMKAESPGPSVSKLVPRVKTTALILYSIYLALTFLMFIVLLISGMTAFDALNSSFATAGTGGFGFRNDSFVSPIHFDSKFNISLPKYPQITIKLDPLPKSLYLLFLSHPEGIFLKEIQNYEKELRCIYSVVSGRKNPTVINRMFNSLVDPTDNPLHKNISIIRRSFMSQLSYEIAQNYIPTHGRNTAHNIPLDDSLIEIPDEIFETSC